MKQLKGTFLRIAAMQVAVLLTVAAAFNVNAAKITGVTATASSENTVFNRVVGNLLDGIPPAGNIPVWQSAGVGVIAGVSDRDPWVLFDLQDVHVLSHMIVANFTENIPSVKEMLVEISPDNVAFTSLGVFTLNLSPVEGVATEYDYPLGDAIARYVRFDILTTYGGSIFPPTEPSHSNGIGDLAGLTEVSFFGGIYVEPPPTTGGGTGVPDAGSTAALLGLSVVGLVGIRRKQPRL